MSKIDRAQKKTFQSCLKVCVEISFLDQLRYRHDNLAMPRLALFVGALVLTSGCAIENPKFNGSGGTPTGFESDSESESESESVGTGGSTATATTATTAVTTTEGPTTTDATATEGETSSVEMCALGQRFVQFEGIENPEDCEFFGVFLEVQIVQNTPYAKICFDQACGNCVPLPFEIDVPPSLFGDSTCFGLFHWGQWQEFDPDIGAGCKTSFVAVFDTQDYEFPIYIGGSRNPQIPQELNPDLQFSVNPINTRECECEAGHCCPDQTALYYDLEFNNGQDTLVLGVGDYESFKLGPYFYGLELLRAHRKGVYGPENSCNTFDFFDWQLVRVPLP